MIIEGRYTKDGNFTTIFSKGCIYTIAKDGSWNYVKIGQRTAMGWILKPIDYKILESECDNYGTFELKEV